MHAQRLVLRPAAVDGNAQLALLRPPAPSRASAKTLRGTGARRARNRQGGGGEGAGEGGGDGDGGDGCGDGCGDGGGDGGGGDGGGDGGGGEGGG